MDASKRPLKIPPEFATYAEEHGIYEMYKRLLESVIINRPADPINFLIEQLRKDNDDVPQIVVLGPPASGKRSMSKMVTSKLRAAHITPENIIEEADVATKNEVKALRDSGKPIPTSLWLKMVQNRVALFDAAKKGWVMDGFPQTREQALAMQAVGIHPKHFVLLDAQDMVLIERAAGKRVDPKTGDVYHVTFDWPNQSDVANRLECPPGTKEEEVIDNLVVYHRHIAGIVECYKKVFKTINADQPRADVFAQVMTFLQSKPRTAAPHTPRVVLLGPTGSGKGVQAALLANKYNIVNVSMGQLIKQAIADEAKSGLACKTYVQKNMLVPDAIVLNVLKERLTQLDCVARGWVLHGYPRTREQAEQLTGAGLAPNRVFSLDVPNDSVVERLTLRATDPVTGTHYHMLYNPPRSQEVKDRLEVHPKDQDEDVRKRLHQHQAYSEEISDYYTIGQHVNADQDPHTVFESIESMVVNPLPKKLTEED